MSFPAMFLACQAAEHLPPPDDEEFGPLAWSDITASPLDIRWAMYRSEGAGVIFGVLSVEQTTDGFIDAVFIP